MALLTREDSPDIAQTALHRPAFFNVAELPWHDWVMPDTWFKLLNVNPYTGGFTMLLKVGPNNLAPVHGHIGSVEGILLEGGFGYGEDRGRAGWYVREPGGINHIPDTDADGMVMFATVNGPLMGYNADGSIAAVVDAKFMYDLAASHGAADHIDKPLDW
ncbi:2,4'-dihydroxyacetophenone dioxygenase family protein [Sphingosinicella microcystinivorans]|uniref:2,4'-dihydroxyacetophenone dioxygenase family protein n=1 Tax=Sphingosinicella microcystinivorans TaxID=335406 RepID=UPI0022F3E835|nr:2,4'-dihydroxyacetophenone dioxygenase family protein [Sphingosinicella microcystinivorans]WBX85372.1 2,4'-dihydroxyacetophenone dioxygenase family protein [Sphingosinicella microcystinivorans]